MDPTITPTVEYDRALTAWRQSRPEYAQLCRGIKTREPIAKLRVLAANAGVSCNELYSLRSLAANAVRMAADAKAFPSVKKERAAIETALAKAQAAYEAAQTRKAEDEALEEISALQEKQLQIQARFATCEVAAATVETATARGVI